MKTSRLKKNAIPVSQNQLAAYLGIKSSTLSMANSAKYNRKLPSGASEKLALLYMDFELMEFEPQKQGSSSVQIKARADKASRKEYNNLMSKAKYFEEGATLLSRTFDEMCRRFSQDIRWLHVIDTRLAASPTKKERIWLDYQKVITTGRIEKNGKLAQFKLQLNLEISRAKATVYRNISKKILASLEDE